MIEVGKIDVAGGVGRQRRRHAEQGCGRTGTVRNWIGPRRGCGRRADTSSSLDGKRLKGGIDAADWGMVSCLPDHADDVIPRVRDVEIACGVEGEPHRLVNARACRVAFVAGVVGLAQQAHHSENASVRGLDFADPAVVGVSDEYVIC